jgi:hypothetical protein
MHVAPSLLKQCLPLGIACWCANLYWYMSDIDPWRYVHGCEGSCGGWVLVRVLMHSIQVALKDSLLVLGKFLDTKGVVQDGTS